MGTTGVGFHSVSNLLRKKDNSFSYPIHSKIFRLLDWHSILSGRRKSIADNPACLRAMAAETSQM